MIGHTCEPIRETIQVEERYTAYTGADGERWVRRGVRTHQQSASARLGLVATGGSGCAAHFD